MMSVNSLIGSSLVRRGLPRVVGATAVDGFAVKPFVPSFASASRSFSQGDPLPLSPWKGATFKNSDPDFKFDVEKPDLRYIPLTKNLDNMDKITRMQKIKYPEFSWYSVIGDPSSRVYTTFAQDVSRIGYDDDGRIWSLVCPQRGIALPMIGTCFVEVTVTGVRGWVDEEKKTCYADVEVEGNLWIEPKHGNPLVESLKPLFKKIDPIGEFPFSKANAVKIDAFHVGRPDKKEWPMVNGMDPNIFQPMNRRHFDDAWSVYNLEVEVGGKIKTKKSPLCDRFDDLILDLFNSASGGLFIPGQRVSWNVWPMAPEGVDTEEWKGHAKLWKDSIHIKHEYPGGKKLADRAVTFFDGTPYQPKRDLPAAIGLIKEFLADTKEIVGPEKAAEIAQSPMISFITNFLNEKRTDHIK